MFTQQPSGPSYTSEIQRLKRENIRLSAVNKQLRSENKLLNQLVDSVQVGMFVKDTDNRFIYVNRAFCDHFHVDAKQILFKEETKISKLLRKYTRGDKKIMKTRRVIFNLFQGKDRKGKAKWVETIKFPWIEHPDVMKGIFGFTYDVTEKCNAEQGWQEARLKLSKANMVNQALRQFSYAASHDLQEPLRSVQGFLTVLQMEYESQLDPKAGGYLQKAHESLERMQQLIKDILDYAVINGAKYHMEPVELEKVVSNVLLNLDQSIQENEAKIEVSGLPEIYGNAGLLVHFFQNMLSNALKYRSPRRKPHIVIEAHNKLHHWLIEIRDNGMGIDPSYFREIFKPFKRLHRQEEIKGSGIGLATSKRIAEIHSGKLWVESAPGTGSSFFLQIPKK